MTLTLGELGTHIARHVSGIAQLRQIIHRPGWSAGRPIWVGVPAIATHIGA